MHPAYSVILFTTSSGAGYGLLIWLALARLGLFKLPVSWVSAMAVGLALLLVTIGLLASTFHLGHPERAWRAFSQWRSSWLSREGVFAVLCYPPALVFGLGLYWNGVPRQWVYFASVATLLLAAMTVISTAMIYASLKAIPRWCNSRVVPVYLLLSLASGGLLFLLVQSVSMRVDAIAIALVALVLLCAWAVKWTYWRSIDREKPKSTPGTATGLGFLGEIRQLEAPHTSENYLLKEMGYVVARKHSERLRRWAIVLGLVIPLLLMLLCLVAFGLTQSVLLLLALLLGFTGILIERWLFFAEARHLVTLFYGREV